MSASGELHTEGRITGYRFGSITVDGRTYRRDVLILPAEVISPWWRTEGHLLQLEDLQRVIEGNIPRLIVGTGASGVMKVPGPLLEELGRLGLKVEVQRTAEAVENFNRIEGAGEEAAAALHLTC